jgi:2,4-dienoyl-CoA reductase-like NADH-dependent reductase (Old Yellow Enzyme family)
MKSLFDETHFSGINMKNRFIRSATYDGLADNRGHMTQALFQVYENLANGGVGTIITGITFVSDIEKSLPGEMGIYDDSFIEEYQKLTEMAHNYNTNIILQVVFAGPPVYAGSQTNISDKVIWGPSSIEDLAFKITPKEMTKEEILFLQKAFADAAFRAKIAGFNGVQIHAAHGYLLSKFLTPYYNRRTDEYGGPIENRARIILETYQGMREKVGPEYPILIKINCDDFMNQGMNFEECQYVCKKLAEMGIDAIEISGGSRSSRPNEGASRIITAEQESYFKFYAEEIAKEINVPVILVGGNRDFQLLTGILNHSSIEYFALCRPLICEWNLVNRWQSGDLKRAKCVSCNKCLRMDGTACIKNV